MVPRYTRPEMAAIWAPENRYRIWFEIEALAAEGMARIGAIPESAAKNIREKGGPRRQRSQRLMSSGSMRSSARRGTTSSPS